MTIVALFFFTLFVGTIFASYIALRRRLAQPTLVGAGCAAGCIVSMMLFALANGNIFTHALLVGLVVGGAFAAATMAVALYFQGAELREELKRKP
jgi:MFS family permease